MSNLRLFVLGGYLSYRALFQWLRPSLFIPTMLIGPTLQILFFALFGRYAGVGGDRFYLVGNAVLACSIPCVFGPMLALSEERASGTLPLVLASPASRIAIFAGRVVPFALNGLLVSCVALVFGGLALGTPIRAGEIPLVLLILVISALSCSGLGLTMGAFGLVSRDVPFLSNLVSIAMLLVSGANVALAVLPAPLRLIGEALPLSRGIEAVRLAVAGAPASRLSSLMLGEVAVGVVYLVLA
ncbi:MAG: ABC transporter permease, partial [Nonomuraea sp.]|nr:ABC transporter permease [Nonomuraea sp.]